MIMATLGNLGGAWPSRRQIVVSVGTTPDAVVDATLDMAVDAELNLIVRLSLDGIASATARRIRRLQCSTTSPAAKLDVFVSASLTASSVRSTTASSARRHDGIVGSRHDVISGLTLAVIVGATARRQQLL